MTNKIKLFIKTHLAMQYRLNRQRFITGLISSALLSLLYSTLSILFESIFQPVAGNFSEKLFSFSYVDPIILLLPFVLSVGRLYDLNKGKKWLILYIIPGVNLAFLLYLLVSPGTAQKNDYGDPVADLSDQELAATVSYFGWHQPSSLGSAFFSWQGRISRSGFFWQFSLINAFSYLFIIIILVVVVLSGISGPMLSLDELASLDDAGMNNLIHQFHLNPDTMASTALLLGGLLFYVNGVLMSSCICLSMRRWHDIGKSGWFVFYSRIPAYLLGWLFAINDNNIWLYYNCLLFLFLVLLPGKSITTAVANPIE